MFNSEVLTDMVRVADKLLYKFQSDFHAVEESRMMLYYLTEDIVNLFKILEKLSGSEYKM